MMTYIHELPDWPDFTWDTQALAQALSAVRHKQGKHLGKMEALGFDLRTEASVTALTSEIVKSSAIEGEQLDTNEVRSSIARKLGLDVAGLPTPGRERILLCVPCSLGRRIWPSLPWRRCTSGTRWRPSYVSPTGPKGGVRSPFHPR